jgi:hypothetical protein
MRISDLPTDFRVLVLNWEASINSSESASTPTRLNLRLHGSQAGARESPLRNGDAASLTERPEEGRVFCPPFPPPDNTACKRAVDQPPSAQRN